MNTKSKIESIRYLKSYVIKHQQYELAGWLREREKELMDEIDLVIDNLVTEIRHTQYHYILGLLDEFYKSPVTGPVIHSIRKI